MDGLKTGTGTDLKIGLEYCYCAGVTEAYLFLGSKLRNVIHVLFRLHEVSPTIRQRDVLIRCCPITILLPKVCIHTEEEGIDETEKGKGERLVHIVKNVEELTPLRVVFYPTLAGD